MHALIKAVCAVHNLSLATVYGGPILVKAALRNAVKKDIKEEKDRIRVMEAMWSAYNRKVNIPAHAVFTATWLIERNALKNLRLDQRGKALIRVKDVLITGALITGVLNAMVGKKLARELPGGQPKAGDTRSTHTILAGYKRYFKVMSPVHMALVGASIAIGPYIGAAVVRSQRGLLSRLFRR